VYHVTLRVNHCCDLFQSDGDREHFLHALSEACHERIEVQYQKRVKGYGHAEDITFRRRDTMVRPVTAKALCDYSGLTRRQVAEVLNVTSGGAVSKQLEKLGEVLRQDKTVQKMLDDLDRLIGSR
jgi:hypothetical protein